MPDDTRDIMEYYNRSAAAEGGRLQIHRLEYDMTWRYLAKYLPKSGKILEIGCAAGAYTVPLAKRGYCVTAVDFAPVLLEVCRQKIKDEHLEKRVNCLVADARDLAAIAADDYDAALIMGPLYHLILEADRQTALRQAFSKLKKGGLLFSVFISRYGIWGDVIKDLPHYIDFQNDVRSVIHQGKDADLAYQKGNFRGYFARVEEIPPLHENIGFKTLVLAGLETAGVRDEAYNKLKGKRRQLWLDLLFSISTEKSIIGASNHVLYIGVKES